MKKSKMFIVAGTALLAISAVFASKANKKFTNFTTAQGASNANYLVISDPAVFTAASGGNLLRPTVKLVTIGASHTVIHSLGALENANNTSQTASMPATDW